MNKKTRQQKQKTLKLFLIASTSYSTERFQTLSLIALMVCVDKYVCVLLFGFFFVFLKP